MPQAATIKSLPRAFRMMKAMQADRIDWGEDYRGGAGKPAYWRRVCAAGSQRTMGFGFFFAAAFNSARSRNRVTKLSKRRCISRRSSAVRSSSVIRDRSR